MAKLTPHKNYADIVIIGNGSAGAGAVYAFNQYLKAHPDSDLTILVLEAQTEEQLAAQIPEYNARITFPYAMKRQFEGIEDVIINTYKRVAFFCPDPDSAVRKNLPSGKKDTTSLVDVTRLIYDVLEKDLHPNIQVRHHKQVYSAEYVGEGKDEKIKLRVQYPFKDEKVFEDTDIFYAKAVIDGSGTGSVIMDWLQGYRNDSDIVCGVLGFKLIRLDDIVLEEKAWGPRDSKLVSLGLDDGERSEGKKRHKKYPGDTHGAGVWDYRNGNISDELKEMIKKWLMDTKNERIRKILAGREIDDKFVQSLPISDGGISSISTIAQAQHYMLNLQRQSESVFTGLPGYRERFNGAAVIPGSWFYKPSPVLQPVSKMAGRRYLLVGDAAGHATPFIGEGIRPGIDMGITAAEILLESFRTNDFSEITLRSKFEKYWMEEYGKFDIYSNLFRHFSTSFGNKDWNKFFKRIDNKLTEEEFFKVLKSQYTFDIAWKIFNTGIIYHYLNYRARQTFDFLTRKMTLRQAASWME